MASSTVLMMGDLVLTEAEVNPVMSAVLDNGLEVSALHNHFFFDSPRMFFMHVHGHGVTADLGKKFQPALALIGTTPPASASTAAPGPRLTASSIPTLSPRRSPPSRFHLRPSGFGGQVALRRTSQSVLIWCERSAFVAPEGGTQRVTPGTLRDPCCQARPSLSAHLTRWSNTRRRSLRLGIGGGPAPDRRDDDRRRDACQEGYLVIRIEQVERKRLGRFSRSTRVNPTADRSPNLFADGNAVARSNLLQSG